MRGSMPLIDLRIAGTMMKGIELDKHGFLAISETKDEWKGADEQDNQLEVLHGPQENWMRNLDEELLRVFFGKALLQHGSELLELNVCDVQGSPCVEMIFEVPKKLSGTTCVGSLFFPRADGTAYTIKVIEHQSDTTVGFPITRAFLAKTKETISFRS